ncbi:MAG TPA: alpha/beta hydrolase [Acidimicrobiales bacterium]|nr:alpha/beta hydrolase [Acidimicrobiales bacterium]
MLSAYVDGKVFGETSGSGTPWLLVLHGWGRSHDDFTDVVRGMGNEEVIDAIAIDLPGFGASPAPDEAWGAKEYATFVKPILDEMTGRVVIVGHSFGGRVAVELAALAGERTAALVLTGVPLLRVQQRARPRMRFRIVRALAGVGLVGRQRLERARERHGSRDYREAQGVMRAVLVRVLAEDYRPALARLGCPVELVWGERDTAVPVEIARAALSVIIDGRLTVIPGVGHFVPTTAPASLRAAVVAHRP